MTPDPAAGAPRRAEATDDPCPLQCFQHAVQVNRADG